MKHEPGHGWGFCGSTAHLPEILLRKILGSYITIVYYAGVAMVGKKFPDSNSIISVDAWKEAFNEEEIDEALNHFFCDALPKNYKKILKEEINKHPLKGIAPATIPLSTNAAKEKWVELAKDFTDIEKEVEAWANANLDSIPNASKNFTEEEDCHEFYDIDEESNEGDDDDED